MPHLALAGEVTDATGMASTLLAREVGYSGSSIAFAQLLSGMERSGLIRREVRGKRTYRITAAGASTGLATASRPTPRASPQVVTASGLDYDELARRLLIQVVRLLAAAASEQPGAAQPGDAIVRERGTRRPVLEELGPGEACLLERLLAPADGTGPGDPG